MKLLLFLVLGIPALILGVCGIIALVGAILGITFGFIGTIVGVVIKVLFNPVVLAILIIAAVITFFRRRMF